MDCEKYIMAIKWILSNSINLKTNNKIEWHEKLGVANTYRLRIIALDPLDIQRKDKQNISILKKN